MVLLVTLTAFLLFMLWLPVDHIKQPPIKIGVLHSLSGTMAAIKMPLVDALRPRSRKMITQIKITPDPIRLTRFSFLEG